MPVWAKHRASPVLGPGYCIQGLFDCCVVAEGHLRMWLSWRDLHSIATSESTDGVHWEPPRLALEVSGGSDWERTDVNRPSVVKVGDLWHMWYTGQNQEAGTGAIGLATSHDGVNWERSRTDPVLAPEAAWEKNSLMCPHVVHQGGRFRMWYSGGDLYEPDAIGYAESEDGVRWTREPFNPVLRPGEGWEKDRVAGACVVPRESDYLAFYVGFAEGYERSSIGVARSSDGLHNWERYGHNPILEAGSDGAWDDCNVYKPFVLPFRGRWMLWYNASRKSDRREQIGLATAQTVDF